MDFRIADTFTDSLARLSGEEQKAAKMAAFDLQVNPASPGLSFHKLDRAQDISVAQMRFLAALDDRGANNNPLTSTEGP